MRAELTRSSRPGDRPQHRRDLGQSRPRACRYTDQLTVGYERQLGARLVGQRRLRPRLRPRHADGARAQPDAARDSTVGDVAERAAGERTR